jgi:hypothetical protein
VVLELECPASRAISSTGTPELDISDTNECPRARHTWDAILSHLRDPADTARLGDSARGRLLYRYAIPLYHHAADAGDDHAAGRLARLLADRGDLDGLRALAAAGDADAAGRLAVVLIREGWGEEAERLRLFGLNLDGSIACA